MSELMMPTMPNYECFLMEHMFTLVCLIICWLCTYSYSWGNISLGLVNLFYQRGQENAKGSLFD